MLQLTNEDRRRIFNLGYFTWVEQQGVSVEDFVAREDQTFWRSLRDLLPQWDKAIRAFNVRAGAGEAARAAWWKVPDTVDAAVVRRGEPRSLQRGARQQPRLPHFRLHDLRHFMATEMAAGVPIATVSQPLGHARASTTLNVYLVSSRSLQLTACARARPRTWTQTVRRAPSGGVAKRGPTRRR
jgi:integrase